MDGFFKKHQDFVVLAVLLILTLAILLSNLKEKSSLNFAEKAVVTALAPFQDAVGWTAAKLAMVWEDYINLVDTKKENRELKGRVDRLAFENSLLVERLKFYQRLDKLLSFPSVNTAAFEAARVIGRDTTDRVKLITINKGAGRGIRENMPVVTYEGLVGRVARVAWGASKVLLITDVRSAIDALAQDTRDSMVVAGTNSPFLEARYLAVNAKVKNGDRIISSGLGGVFPKGLLIGELRDVRTQRDSLFTSAKVAPMVNLDRLEEVLVLKTAPTPKEFAGDGE